MSSSNSCVLLSAYLDRHLYLKLSARKGFGTETLTWQSRTWAHGSGLDSHSAMRAAIAEGELCTLVMFPPSSRRSQAMLCCSCLSLCPSWKPKSLCTLHWPPRSCQNRP